MIEKRSGSARTAGAGNSKSSKGDIFKVLGVFDRLEVGPISVEKRKITAPHTIYTGRSKDTAELIYRFEEDVFKPGDAASMNLACMVAAQVAINYGLFCRSIVFHGQFDETDRRFIREMAQNTAREIFVKKFLEPNPFLTGKAATIKPVKLSNYLLARIEFPDAPVGDFGSLWTFHPSNRENYAVLSSGGKDSLLTFGLLNEMGGTVHPIFINESGRHWFTALNAYRHFSEHVPNTSRVWVNSDRLFAWFLRRIPFIRKDFLDIRSDEYAIRLWTVAIFLFGALPLALKWGAGRICIGDEYDTTQRTSFRGITHYNGFYDQSRHFDNALSRYYLRKGWAISQFSILRTLSEILIEKVLVSRYPDLQTQQVSCHATHMKDGRVFPCGKCEKCRRIVGMLTALDADPRRCGYTESQINECLRNIPKKGVHQEPAGVEQLFMMLSGKGVLQLPEAQQRSLKAHSEILKLRFDSKRSLIEEIPVDLRKPLLNILLKYTDGSARRCGRAWIDFDPLSDQAINKAYAFELEHIALTEVGKKKGEESLQQNYLWGELTWQEVEHRISEVDVALLPVGSIEQHGPHLPLDTDSFDAEYLAHRIAEACSYPKPFVLPLIPYGVSYEHSEFKGTMGINNDTLANLVYEIGMNAARNGINKLVIINGHGGNIPALNYAAQMITRDTKIFVCVDTGETSDVDIYRLAETSEDIHAGEIETSTSLAVRPHLVRMEKVVKNVPRFSSRYLNFTSKRKVSWFVHTKRISKSGVIGDPTKADAEKGEQMWRVMISHLVALVEDLKSMTLEEIYQRRY